MFVVSKPDGGVLATPAALSNVVYTAPGSAIPDAPNDMTPGMLDVPLMVNITDPNWLSSNLPLNDIEVGVNIHHDNVSELSIDLVSPGGGRTVHLLQNRSGIGGAPTQGIGSGQDLGMVNRFHDAGLVFDDKSARNVTDTNITMSDHVGHFTSETNMLTSTFAGMRPSQLNGRWDLKIYDNQMDGGMVTQFLDNAWLNLTAAISTTSFGTDTDPLTIFGGGFGNNVNAPVYAPLLGATLTPGAIPVYPTQNIPAGGIYGIGPSVSIAVDNSLGSFSPYAGRVYVAYTGRRGTAN